MPRQSSSQFDRRDFLRLSGGAIGGGLCGLWAGAASAFPSRPHPRPFSQSPHPRPFSQSPHPRPLSQRERGEWETAAAGEWAMRLATSTVQFAELKIEQACRRIAAAGFEAVDIWDSAFNCPHLDEAKDRLGAEGLKELLAECKLKLCAFSCYGRGYPHYAELLGGVGGGVAVHGSRSGKVENLRAEMRTYLEKLRPEIELAEKYDSYIAVENHRVALLDSLDSFKAFVDMNRSPRLGIALAPYHIQLRGESVEEAIAIAGRQLFFFYAWQHGEGLNQLPGVGPTDFAPWLAALAKSQYPRFVNPFMHGKVPADEMSRSLAAAKAYLEKRLVQARKARQ